MKKLLTLLCMILFVSFMCSELFAQKTGFNGLNLNMGNLM